MAASNAHTTYTARVSGTIWSGHRAWTEYTFQQLPTREEIIARAADFADVKTVLLTARTVTVERVSLHRSNRRYHG